MKILLISPLLTQRKPVHHNIGLSYIAAVIEKAGYDLELLDIEGYKYSDSEVINLIKKNNPDIVCIGTIITGFKYVKWLCDIIKKIIPKAIIILGNSIATTIPEIALKNLNVDYLVIGEGEITIIELLKAIENNTDISKVNGICYKIENQIIFTTPRELISDIDTIPIPAWHLFPLKEIYFKNSSYLLKPPIGHIISTRGCPFKCIYCYHSFKDKKIRKHSPERIIEEMKLLVKTYNIRSLGFSDDLFVIDKKRIYEMCDLMDKEKIKLKWRVTCRANFIDENLLQRMKSSGLIEIAIGAESASQIILDNVRKQVKKEELIKGFEIAKRVGIGIRASYMVGNIGETKETIFETVDFIKKHDNKPPFGFFITTPYPDTELYKYGLQCKLIKNELDLINSYGEQSKKILINFSMMKDNELYKTKRKAIKILILNYLKTNPIRGMIYIIKTMIKKIISIF